MADCLEELAGVGPPKDGAILLGAASRLRRESGAPVPPVRRPEVEDLSRSLAAALGEGPFSEALASGSALSVDEATDHALAMCDAAS